MTEPMSLWIWLSCFVGMFAVDVCWVYYMDKANNDRAHPAAFWALMLHAFGSGNTLVYTEDARYLSATLLGTYVGTWAVVEYKRRKKIREAVKVLAQAEVANPGSVLGRLNLTRIPASPLVGEPLERAAQARSFALGNLAASDSASAGARAYARRELGLDPDCGHTRPIVCGRCPDCGEGPGDTMPAGAKVVEGDEA